MDVTIQAALITVVAGISGGALTWCFRLESRVVRLGTISEIAERSVSAHGDKVADHDARIARVEQAHVAIAQAQGVQQVQSQQIIERLNVLSELKASVDSLAANYKELHDQVVPRSEIQVIREATAGRLDRIEKAMKVQE